MISQGEKLKEQPVFTWEASIDEHDLRGLNELDRERVIEKRVIS